MYFITEKKVCRMEKNKIAIEYITYITFITYIFLAFSYSTFLESISAEIKD